MVSYATSKNLLQLLDTNLRGKMRFFIVSSLPAFDTITNGIQFAALRWEWISKRAHCKTMILINWKLSFAAKRGAYVGDMTYLFAEKLIFGRFDC